MSRKRAEALCQIIRFVAVLLLLPNAGLMADEVTHPVTPLRMAVGQTLRPEDENRVVEVEGSVVFAGAEGRAVYVEIGSEAGLMSVTIAEGAGYLTDLLPRSRIQARGTCTTLRSSMDGRPVASLQVSTRGDVVVLQLPEETWERHPLADIGTLLKARLSERIYHLRGRAQSVYPESGFLLADGTGQTMMVETNQAVEEVGTDLEVLGICQQRGKDKVLQSICFRSVGAAGKQSALPTLTTTEQVRWLKPGEARRKYPVKIQGIITYLAERQGKRAGGDLQDGTGGIFLWEFRSLDAAAVSGVNVGDFCEVEGVTSRGAFSPMILCRKLTVLGGGQFPDPIRPQWDELIHGGLDAQWAEIEGLVISTTTRGLELGIQGGRILCTVPWGHWERYVGAIVRVRGVVHSNRHQDRRIMGVQINVPSQKFVSMVSPAPGDPFLAPIAHTNDLFTYNPGESAFRRVKVGGQVVHVRNGVCFLMDGQNGMRLVPRNESDARIGDIVEAVGFPDIDRPFDKPLLTLREAVVRKTAHRSLPAAIEVARDDLLNREHDSTLVRMDSRLLNVTPYQAEQVLELQTGALVYFARLDTASGTLPPLRVGSQLEVAGVYSVVGDHSAPFELLLNSPADVRVLRLPSWWTTQHALIVVCSMAALILLAAIWIAMLQQQVGKRTVQLSVANQSLVGEIAERGRMENELVRTRLQHLVEKERTRIARDLHDDLGSRVTRMVLLLDELALQNCIPSPEAASHPVEISGAAREIIQSLDETVWAVNPRNDTLAHLLNYLSHFAIEFLQAANVRCRLDLPNHPPGRTILADARHNLFLATKEALNNAVRHAHASEVWLRGVITEQSLVLTIEDNGRGFEPAPTHPSADGLRNMRQRMEDAGGEFKIESQSNLGTKVILTFFWSPKE